jgi:hypothetical protein
MVKFTIGNKTFTSIKQCTTYTRAILEELYELCGDDKLVKETHPEYFNYLCALVKRHPYHEEKMKRFIDFKIVPAAFRFFTTGKNIIIIDDESLLTHSNNGYLNCKHLSWKICVEGKCPSSNEMFNRVLRIVIEDQIYQHRLQSTETICALCNQSMSGKQTHVDHAEPQFSQLVDDFININKIVIPDRYGKEPVKFTPIFCNTDSWIADQFADYHLQNATLRVVCGDCNVRRPKYYAQKK